MLHCAIRLRQRTFSAYSASMKSRKGAAPPQSAPPAKPPQPVQREIAQRAAPQPKAATPPSAAKPTPAAPSEPAKRPVSAQAPVAQAAPAEAASSPAKPVPQVPRPAPIEPIKAQHPAPTSPAAPVPFNHFPRAAEPVQKFARRTAENPAPRAEPAVQPGKARTSDPVKAAPADMPASVRQNAQAAPAASPPAPAASPPASGLIPVKRPLGRPRKVAPLAPADVADIVQAHLPDTQPAANPVPVAEAVAQTRVAQGAALSGPDPAQGKPGRSFGAPSAPLAAKAHQPLCAYSAQVKTLATDAEIAAAAQALGADDVVVLRQVDRLRRLGGHSRTLCATDDAAVDRLTKAGLVVVLPWNGPKPPEPPCYAELTPAGVAVLALCPQPARSTAQESDETVKTLQRYVEPRKTGRPPGRD
mgnify:CR=1 FL=1